MHATENPTPYLPPAPFMTSDDKFEQYAIGELLITCAEECPGLSAEAFEAALRVGSRIMRSAFAGVRDTAVLA